MLAGEREVVTGVGWCDENWGLLEKEVVKVTLIPLPAPLPNNLPLLLSLQQPLLENQLLFRRILCASGSVTVALTTSPEDPPQGVSISSVHGAHIFKINIEKAANC